MGDLTNFLGETDLIFHDHKKNGGFLRKYPGLLDFKEGEFIQLSNPTGKIIPVREGKYCVVKSKELIFQYQVRIDDDEKEPDKIYKIVACERIED